MLESQKQNQQGRSSIRLIKNLAPMMRCFDLPGRDSKTGRTRSVIFAPREIKELAEDDVSGSLQIQNALRAGELLDVTKS